MTMQKLIQTEQLTLRDPIDSDDEALYSTFSDPESMKYIGPERPLSLAETQAWLENHASLLEPEGFSPWVAVLRQTSMVVGWGGLTRDSRDEEPKNELIYIIHPSYCGRGLATELAAAAVNYGFKTLDLPSVETWVHSRNVASIRVLEKVGFKQDGEYKPGWPFYRMLRSEYLH